MLRAVALSKKCKSEPGKVSPKVGAVVAKNGKFIEGAFRGEKEPGEHAEFTLLEKKLAERQLAGATLYVTLEPCTVRNPPKRPCAQRIAARHIKKVFFAMLDPNKDILGSGETALREAGIAVARFDDDLAPLVEELNRHFIAEQKARSKRRRSRAATSDPVKAGEKGPNGHRVGYTRSGDKVEWIPDEERPGKEWPLVLRRNDRAILAAYKEFWDKVWWNRQQVRFEKIKRGEVRLTKQEKAVLRLSKAGVKKVERKYGKKNLGWDDFEWGLLSGRMSALAWVMGAQWNESLDT
jgi:pyrimidine deaminase RibD-like protein